MSPSARSAGRRFSSLARQAVSARPSRLSSANVEYGYSWGRAQPTAEKLAAERIRSRVPNADLEVVAADLSLMQEVRSLAYQIMDSTPRLDGLILNAAEARSDLVLTAEGIETNFATNHLAGFLLTHLLLPLLRSSAPARVIVISSSVHSQVRMVDLNSVVTGAPLTPDSYRTSKLLNILFVREARQTSGGHRNHS